MLTFHYITLISKLRRDLWIYSHSITLLQIHDLVYLCLCGFGASCEGMERILGFT